MNDRVRLAGAAGLTVLVFVLIQIGALVLVEPFKSAGFQPVDDPSDPTNSIQYFVVILLVTAGMLLAFRYDLDRFIRATIVFISGLLSWYVFVVVLPPAVVVADVHVIAVGAAGLVALGLAVHPEWYVIDTAGVAMGAGAAGLFGITFSPLPALLLLSVLAIYDAISVYGTEHMLTLAEGVMDLNVPVVLVIPTSLDYSFRSGGTPEALDDAEDGTGDDGSARSAADGEAAVSESGTGDDADTGDDTETRDDAEDDGLRDALFIGLGDAVMPTILVASAAFFVDVPAVVGGANLPALGAAIGTIVGLLALLWLVMKGRAHAGLPLLNGGSIAGYLLGAIAAGIPLVEAVGLAPYL